MKTLIVELLVLVAFSVTLCHSSPQCPRGWINFRRSCYLFNKNYRNWYEAAAACRRQGAHLVTVDDADENQFILNELMAQQNFQYFGIKHYRTYFDGSTYGDSSSDYSIVWIGLTDLYQEGRWQWSDTASLSDFSYWGWTGMQQTDDSRNCVHYGMPSTMQWHAASCLLPGNFICEV